MKQIIQNYGSGKLSVEEQPMPQLLRGGVLVRNQASLISAGTERSIVQLAQKSLIGKARQRPDLVRKVLKALKTQGWKQTFETVKARLDQPTPLGYSCAGDVLAVASGLDGYTPGQRIACAGASYATHAEVVFVPKNLCVPIPENVSYEDASYVTVGAIAMQGVRQAEVRVGDVVVVLGLGLIGQLTVQILKASGATVIGTDLDPSKVELAKTLGADAADTDSEEISTIVNAFSGGQGADRVIITASTPSHEPLNSAAEWCRDKGAVIAVGLVGLNVPRDVFYRKELDLKLSRSYGPGRYDSEYEERGHDYPYGYVRWTQQRNLASFLHLISEGKIAIDKITTHRFSIDNAEQAYAIIKGENPEPHMGIVLQYDAESKLATRVSLESAPAKPASGTITLGVIGAGSFVKSVLLPKIKPLPNVSMGGIVTATGITAQSIGKAYNFSYCTSSVDELLEDSSINAVLIGTRHDSHADLVCRALEKGKHVFVEKPLAVNEAELQKVIETATQHAHVLQVGFNRRFSPAARSVREQFASRKEPLSMVYRVNAGAIPPGHWVHDPVEGGGRIIGEGCHFIDLLQYFAGALPTRVFAQNVMKQNPEQNTEDIVTLQVQFEDGSIGTIHYFANGPTGIAKEMVEVFGAGKYARIDDFNSLALSDGGQPKHEKYAAQDKGHAEELRCFFESIRSGTRGPINFEDMIAVTRTSFRAVDSLRCGEVLSITDSE